MRLLLCLAGLCLPSVLLAGPPFTEQQSLAEKLGEKVQRFEMWTDDDGNVTGLIFINHQALTSSVGEKPGITDTDLQQLTRFPKLTAVNLESQPLKLNLFADKAFGWDDVTEGSRLDFCAVCGEVRLRGE